MLGSLFLERVTPYPKRLEYKNRLIYLRNLSPGLYRDFLEKYFVYNIFKKLQEKMGAVFIHYSYRQMTFVIKIKCSQSYELSLVFLTKFDNQIPPFAPKIG